MMLDRITFTSALGVCVGIEDRGGKQVHAHIVRIGVESCIFVGSALLACMRIVEVWRKQIECLTICQKGMWCRGLP